MLILAIDGGTSKTRACVVSSERGVLSSAAVNAGVADVARTGERNVLREAAFDACSRALSQAGAGWGALNRVVASGMITSPLGLYELQHVPAPAGKRELARGSVEVELVGFPRPVLFIPGVKSGEGESLEIIRGEEVEVVGLLEELTPGGGRTFLFAGSHGKVIETDLSGRVSSIFTFLFGELMRAVAKETILAAFLPRPPLVEAARASLSAGLKDAREHGLGHALFRVRVMGMLETTAEERGSFLFGACAEPAVRRLKGSRAEEVVVCAGGVQGEALAHLLRETGFAPEVLPERLARDGSALGALAVATARAFRDGPALR